MPGRVEGRLATGRSVEGRLSGRRSAALPPPGRLGRTSPPPDGRSGRFGLSFPPPAGRSGRFGFVFPPPAGRSDRLGRVSGIEGRVVGFCTEGRWISGRLTSGRSTGVGREGTLACGLEAGLGSGLEAGRFTCEPVMGLRLGADICGRPPPPRDPPPPPPRRSRAPASGVTRARPRRKVRNKVGFFIMSRGSEGFNWWPVREPDGRCGGGCRAGPRHRRRGGWRSRGVCWDLPLSGPGWLRGFRHRRWCLRCG
jgi:hypothetical protein